MRQATKPKKSFKVGQFQSTHPYRMRQRFFPLKPSLSTYFNRNHHKFKVSNGTYWKYSLKIPVFWCEHPRDSMFTLGSHLVLRQINTSNTFQKKQLSVKGMVLESFLSYAIMRYLNL